MDSNYFTRIFLIGTIFAAFSISSNLVHSRSKVPFYSSEHLGNSDKAGTFLPAPCNEDSDCDQLCHKGNFLSSRCDVNGTCICDCSDPKVVNSSYTSACSGGQPEGYYWDKCDSYCRQEYRRPCRYCTSDQANYFCTCVCNYPAKINEDGHDHHHNVTK